MVHVAVLGARGYLGRELMRLLVAHPKVAAITPISGTEAGTPYGSLVPAFRHRRDLVMQSATAAAGADVVFLATDAEEARKGAAALPDARHVIDLSRAHRHAAFDAGSGWTYGLSEFLPVARGARRVANPGCYPTATLLAAGPALAHGLAGPGPLISDGKSGVSGAGATPRGDLHFPEANEAMRAYKVLGHDHLAEIRLAAHLIEGRAAPTARAIPAAPAPAPADAPGATRGAAGGPPAASGGRAVRFTPHLVPQNRGLLATVYLPLRDGAGAAEVRQAYEATYNAGTAPFVRLVPEPDTSHVRGSNFADVAVDVDAEAGLLVARCAIDNLVKGGSGAAVQNMNLALGLDPALGLAAVGGGP